MATEIDAAGSRSVRGRIMEAIAAALRAASLEAEIPAVRLERPENPANGDVSCNIAFVIGKKLGRNPIALAHEIVSRIPLDQAFIDRVGVAGPGFINFYLAHRFLTDEVRTVIRLRGDYGQSGAGAGRKLQVEFVSANPTGPLVLVSARAAAVGSALVNLLRKAGWVVEAEYYINDAGTQVEKLGASMLVRFRERLGETVSFPEDGYPGSYLVDIAGEIPPEEGRAWLARGEGEAIKAFGGFALERLIATIKSDLELFGVYYDVFFRESTLYAGAGEVGETLDLLASRSAVYDEAGARWFRSAELGDEKDRVLVRSDGSPTYFLADAAYHRNKLRRGFEQVIDIWGPDHHGHIKRLEAAVGVIGAPKGWLEVLIVQWVRLIEGGKQVSMSKRGGEFITLRDLVQDVGVDAAKFFFLMRKTSAHLDFNLTLARTESDENPVYYVQYAHARISSVVAYARDAGVAFPADDSCVELLRESEEIDLMRKIVLFPGLVLDAAELREPHQLTGYAQQLAASFHRFYHICRIVSNDRCLSEARLLLAEATRIVLAETLRILGVSAPEKMRREE